MPNRASRVRAERSHSHPSSHRNRRSARRTARNACRVPGVPNRSKRGVFRRRPHCKLIQVSLPDDQGAGRLQPFDCGCRVWRLIVEEYSRARRSAHTAEYHIVFDGDNRSRKRRKLLGPIDCAINLLGARNRLLACDCDERVEIREKVDAVKSRAADIDRFDVT